MQQQMLSNFSRYGKTAIDSTKELVAINGRLISKVLDNQIQFASTVVESGTKEVDPAIAKDPKALFEFQSSLFEEYSVIFKSQAETGAKAFQEAGEEYKTWFEKSIKTADEAVKEVTETVAKAPVAAAPKAAPAKKPAAKKAPAKKAAPKAAAPAKKPAAKAAPKKAPAKKAAAKA